MSAKEELVNYIINFTPDQLERFLNNQITLSILQPGATSGSYLPAALLNAQ